jgi:hypothetical protein
MLLGDGNVPTTWIQADGRRREARIWQEWFRLVPVIREEFLSVIDDDPLFYNETASVGVLAGAASRVGLLALAEYSATKRGTGRGRPHRHGRCDLWVCEVEGKSSWSFELKQLFCSKSARRGTIAGALERACRDARAVHPLEADHRFGGLLVSGRDGCKLTGATVQCIEAIASEKTFSWCFDGGIGPVWLIIQQV